MKRRRSEESSRRIAQAVHPRLRRVPAAQPQRVGPHVARLRKRSHAISHRQRRCAPAIAAIADAGGLLTRQRAPLSRRRLPRWRQSCDRRAQAGRRAYLRAMASTRRRDRGRPGGACGHPVARTEDPGPSVHRGDGQAARDARSRLAARPPRPGDARVVLRLGPPVERADRPRSRRLESECADGARAGQGEERAARSHDTNRGGRDPGVPAGSREDGRGGPRRAWPRYVARPGQAAVASSTRSL